MISKVKSVQGNGTWDSPNGTLYQFDYEFEDGVMLQANHKSTPSPFKAGDTVEYIVKSEHPKYGKKGSVSRPKEDAHTSSQNGNTDTKVSPEVWRKKDIAIIYQNALTQANQLRMNIGFSKSEPKDIIDELCDTADIIAKFVIQKSGI